MIPSKYWQQALDVQDTSNLRGIARSFVEVLDAIAEGQGHSDVATHPITRLWVDKFTHLAGIQHLGHARVLEAYADVRSGLFYAKAAENLADQAAEGETHG